MKKEMIIKLAKIAVKKWKSRLGFSGWKIGIRIAVFNRLDDFPQDGDLVVNYSKKTATILISTILKSPVEEIVVHELVHLMLWPVDQQMASMIKRLPQSKQKRIENVFLGKLEKVVDQITRNFLRTKK